MRDLVATRKVYYARKEYAAGERFTAQTDRDAETLIMVGAAKAAPPEEPKKVPPRRTKQEATAEVEPSQTYKRRDMTAEDL